jgi:hypothetical protein
MVRMSVALSVVIMGVGSSALALPASPAGHYAKRKGGIGEMSVERSGNRWRVFVSAGGIPNGGATAADCTLIALGDIRDNKFSGEIKFSPEPADEKPGPENAVGRGHRISLTFSASAATLGEADVGDICAEGTGLFGRYLRTKAK